MCGDASEFLQVSIPVISLTTWIYWCTIECIVLILREGLAVPILVNASGQRRASAHQFEHRFMNYCCLLRTFFYYSAWVVGKSKETLSVACWESTRQFQSTGSIKYIVN